MKRYCLASISLFLILLFSSSCSTHRTMFISNKIELQPQLESLVKSIEAEPSEQLKESEQVNPILIAWHFMKSDFEQRGLKTVETIKTPDGRRSYVMYSETWRSYLAPSISDYLKPGEMGDPLTACGYDFLHPHETFMCCCCYQPYERFTLNCVQQLRWDSNHLNDLGVKVMKCAFALGVIRMLAQEFARHTFYITIIDINNRKIPSNSLLYLWNYDTGVKDRFLMTKVDDSLMERTALLMQGVLPKFRNWIGVLPERNVEYMCSQSGISRNQGYTTCSSLYAPLMISTGQPTDILHPTNTPPYGTTMQFVGEMKKNGCIDLDIHGSSPPVGGTNTSLVDAFRRYRSMNSDPLECFGSGFSDKFLQAPNIFNTKESSVFVFYSLLVWAQFQDLSSIHMMDVIGSTCTGNVEKNLNSAIEDRKFDDKLITNK